MVANDGSLTNITTAGDYNLVVIDSNGCNYSFGPFSVDLIDFVEDVTFSNSISISPNPADEFIVITQNDHLRPLEVFVYSINNQLLDTYHFSERKNRVNIIFSNEKINKTINKNIFAYSIPENYDIIEQ